MSNHHDNHQSDVPATSRPGGIPNVAPSRAEGAGRRGRIPAPALATAMGGLPTSPTAGPDPIFAVIDEHYAIMAEWEDAIDRDDEDASDECCHREVECTLKVLTAQPTTLAGVMALLEHVGQSQFLDDDPRHDKSVLSVWGPGCGNEPLLEAAKLFPTRLAATMHLIMEGARS